MGSYVPRIRYSKNVYRILMVKPRENVHLEDREGGWRIILRLTLGQWLCEWQIDVTGLGSCPSGRL